MHGVTRHEAAVENRRKVAAVGKVGKAGEEFSRFSNLAINALKITVERSFVIRSENPLSPNFLFRNKCETHCLAVAAAI